MDQWYQADPTQKVLCFSSFVQYLKLVAAYLRTKSINYELYTGEMSQLEREETIKRFTGNDAEDAPRVMLSAQSSWKLIQLTSLVFLSSAAAWA